MPNLGRTSNTLVPMSERKEKSKLEPVEAGPEIPQSPKQLKLLLIEKETELEKVKLYRSKNNTVELIDEEAGIRKEIVELEDKLKKATATSTPPDGESICLAALVRPEMISRLRSIRPIRRSRSNALTLRLSCYASACANASLARLAAHTWRHLWFFSGHPNFRTGTLCYSVGWTPIRLVCKGNLDDPGFCAIFTHQADIGDLEGTSEDAGGFKTLPNTLAMECILCGDPDRLATLDVALLEEEVVGPERMALSAFQYAAALGRLDCFGILIDKLGVTSPLLVDPDGKLTSGVLACCGARFPFGHREGILHLLLSRLSWDSFRPEPLLESASVFGTLWMLSFVFSRFAEAEKKGIAAAVDLAQCLVTASENGHTDCARLLLEQGADANVKCGGGGAALIQASRYGHTDCARMLLEHGADANVKDQYGQAALLHASEKGHTDCARLLLEHGADVNFKDRYGMTALRMASRTDIVRLLKEHGAS